MMPDTADIASDIIDATVADAARAAAAPLAAGAPGWCDGCEWFMPRLVGGLCGFCRDGRKPPPDWEPPAPPAGVPCSAPTPAEAAPPVIEETPAMTEPTFKIAITGAAAAAVKLFADGHDVAMTHAAAALIERGAAAAAVAPAPADVGGLSNEALIGELVGRLVDPGHKAHVASLVQRAEAAEGLVAAARAALIS